MLNINSNSLDEDSLNFHLLYVLKFKFFPKEFQCYEFCHLNAVKSINPISDRTRRKYGPYLVPSDPYLLHSAPSDYFYATGFPSVHQPRRYSNHVG